MRLIDADKIKEKLEEMLKLAVKRVDDTPTNSPCYRMYVEQENERSRLIDIIDDAPTVECVALTEDAYSDLCLRASRARPKGEWIEENSETGAIGIKYTWVRCNQCGWHNSLVIPKNFCPNCGADMRGDANGETT